MDGPRYSVVIPIRDEIEVLPELTRRLTEVLDGLGGEWEVIFVDDGSRDGSYAHMVDLHERDPRFKVVLLSQGFGLEISLTAGLDLASGDAVLTMDGDLQHPPEVIPELVARWREGNEVVWAVMAERLGETWFRRKATSLSHRLIRRLTKVDIPIGGGNFRLVDRRALDAFKAMRESNRYVRGLFAWIGFRQVDVPYVCPPRLAGHTKYGTRRLVGVGMDAIIGFSHVPLRLALTAGFVVALASIAFGLSAVVTALTSEIDVPGWTSIMVLVGIVGGIQLMLLGVVGEYIARIYDEVKSRPLYLVSETHGLSDRVR